MRNEMVIWNYFVGMDAVSYNKSLRSVGRHLMSYNDIIATRKSNRAFLIWVLKRFLFNDVRFHIKHVLSYLPQFTVHNKTAVGGRFISITTSQHINKAISILGKYTEIEDYHKKET